MNTTTAEEQAYLARLIFKNYEHIKSFALRESSTTKSLQVESINNVVFKENAHHVVVYLEMTPLSSSMKSLLVELGLEHNAAIILFEAFAHFKVGPETEFKALDYV